MESTNTTSNERNGHNKTVVLEKELITDSETLERVSSPDVKLVHPGLEVKAELPDSPKRKKPTALILAGLSVVAIAAGVYGYHWWQFASTHQETDDATVSGHVHQVSSRIAGTVSEVLVNDNQQVQRGQLLVKLDPRDYATKVRQAEASLLSAQRQANAAQANINLSAQTTTAKTTQAQGDMSGAIAAISTAQAAVKEAEAGIPAAQAEVQVAQAGIPSAQALVAQADANLQKTQADYNRYNSLFNQGAVARQQLETAKAAYDVVVAQKSGAVQGVAQAQARLAEAKVGVAKAESQLAQAQEGIVTARSKLATSKGGMQQATAGEQQTVANRSQYEAAKAAIIQAQASLQDAQLQLSYTSITAPATGLVGRKTVEVGNRVQVASPLLAIVNNEYWVVANFKETQLENMKPGEDVEIKLDSFPHHVFKGRIDSLSPGSGAQFALLPPDNATGNFTKIVQRIPVKVVFDQESIKGYESRITPGMSAIVSVKVK